MKPIRFFAVPLALSIALMQGFATAQTRTSPTPTASVSAEGSVTNSNMSAELFYQLLLGELNARNGEPGTGYSLVLDAARKTNDAALYRRAVELALQGRAGEPALAAARAWKQAQPQSIDANRNVLQVLLALGRVQETVEPLKTEIALTPAPERPATIALIPRFYARAADKKLAATTVEQALSEAIAQTGTASAAWTSIGRMRLAAGDVPAALDAAASGQQAEVGALGPALLALEIMEPKQPRAEEIIQRYLTTPQAVVELRMGYARNLLDVQRYSEAGLQVQQITQSKPDFPEAWLVQGSLALQDNQIDRADTSLKRYLDLMNAQPNSEEKERGLTQAYLSLAQVAEKRKDFTLAESWLSKIDSPQALVSTQNRRASMLAKQGKLTEARELIRRLPERSGEQGEQDRRMKLNSEIALLRDNKQHQAAYDLLTTAVAKSPQDVELMYDQAMMAEKLDRLGEMERILRRVMEIKPDFHHAYNALGYSLADRKVRLPEAKQLIQKALEFAPGDPYITDSLGWVEYRMGNSAEAIRLLEQAYKTKPDAEIAAHLGEVYWAAGQRDKARAIWKEGLILSSDNETLQETLKRLQVKL
jgi:tetratricopeptide (TPR) repeat protein